jgi:hypothetical protein
MDPIEGVVGLFVVPRTHTRLNDAVVFWLVNNLAYWIQINNSYDDIFECSIYNIHLVSTEIIKVSIKFKFCLYDSILNWNIVESGVKHHSTHTYLIIDVLIQITSAL